jgi:hypothetical protein
MPADNVRICCSLSRASRSIGAPALPRRCLSDWTTCDGECGESPGCLIPTKGNGYVDTTGVGGTDAVVEAEGAEVDVRGGADPGSVSDGVGVVDVVEALTGI